MGPFLLLNASLVGFFGFASIYHLILWQANRRETLLGVFGLDCAFRAVMSGVVMSIATSATVAEAQHSLHARIAVGLLVMTTWLWSVSLLADVPAPRLVWPITAILLSLFVLHVFVFPLNATVLSVGQYRLPWGELVSNPKLGAPGWWFGPLCALMIVTEGFGLYCGSKLWQRDRTAALIILVATCSLLVLHVTDMMRIRGQLDRPFVGAIGHVIWAGMIGLVIARRNLQMRAALEASEQRFRGIFDQTFQFIGLISTSGRMIEANRTALEFAGLRPQDVIGKPFWETPWWSHSPALQDRLKEAIRDAAHGQTVRFEATHPAADGKVVYVDFSLKPVRNERGEVTMLIPEGRDITERKSIEQSLRESEERFRALVEHGFEGINIVDRNCSLIYAGPGNRSVLGYSAEEVRGRNTFETIHPEDLAGAQQTWQQILANPKLVCMTQVRLKHKDGTWRWMEVSACNLLDHPAIQGVVVNWRDFTERKLAKDKLRESEERKAAIFESALDALITIDQDGKLVEWNPAAARIFGYQAEQAIGREMAELVIPPRMRDAHRSGMEQLRITGKGSVLRKLIELRAMRADGTEFPAEVYITPIRTQSPSFSGFIRDITERKQAEEERRKLEAQILHGQKLESLGVLAGGIAHDFNNLLTAMLGNASLALMQLPEDSPAVPMLREVEQAAERAADLTRQMLAYSGKGRFEIQPLRLDALVQEMAKLLKSVVSRKVSLDLNLESATIEGDPTQLRQVVMNLIINASDAMESKVGTIRVRTGTMQASVADLHSPYLPDELPPGDYAFLEVDDAGCGMSAETQAKIFDPFFTTKFTGRGLGLAAVLGIVRSHRGTIKVTSTLGEGTHFQMLFPCTSNEPLMPLESENQLIRQQGKGTILVVDDEPSINSFIRLVLENAGFEAMTAEDGREGLKLLQENSRQLVAVLLDLTMPGMDGLEVMREMRRLSPNIPVLVMSGYSEQEVSVRCAGIGANGFIQKPFNPRSLIAAVSGVLADSGATSDQA